MGITEALILCTLAIWIGWDAYAEWKLGNQATESQVIRGWSKHPAVPFAAGLLAGHLFLCDAALPWLK